MRFLLVRHASAGERDEWPGDDRLRPLDDRGIRQAEALISVLVKQGTDRLLSSPYARCVQTLDPAREPLGLAVELRDELAEGADTEAVRKMLRGLAGTPALSTHGDVVEALLGEESEKGSVWILDLERGRLRRELYVPPGA